jgi:hypothetical protein
MEDYKIKADENRREANKAARKAEQDAKKGTLPMPEGEPGQVQPPTRLSN